jgi:hypothetical protein
MKRTSEVPFMMKGTPCSSRRRATLKTLWKTHYLARSGNPAKRVRGVPGMFGSLEVKVLYPT